MKSSVAVLLLLHGVAVCPVRQYVHINITTSWDSAQRYCREKYVDLATVTSEEENQRMTRMLIDASDTWIGLNRAAPGSNIWQWSDGEPPRFFSWWINQPDNFGGFENCVMANLKGWNDLPCGSPVTFFCFWRFVLVKDSKTWEEAREYCRRHYTGLASPLSQEQLELAGNELLQTRTLRVWTGVQFVNGKWISVGKSPLVSLASLPSCPNRLHRCGALNTETNESENRDCAEELNFLCY